MHRLLSAAFAGGFALAAQAAGFTLSSPTIKPGSMLTDAQVFKGFGCEGDDLGTPAQALGEGDVDVGAGGEGDDLIAVRE